MLTDKNIMRDTFHKEIKSFMKNLILVFPDNRDIKVLSSSLNIAIMDDPDDAVVKEFYESFSPCESLIYSKNETLFTGKVIKNKDTELFAKIGDYWNLLHIDNKEVVWQYISVLYELSKKIVHYSTR